MVNVSTHLYDFQTTPDAFDALSKWWENQRRQGVASSAFDIVVAVGITEVRISHPSSNEQQAFEAFLAVNFAGRYTVHNDRQVHTFFDGS